MLDADAKRIPDPLYDLGLYIHSYHQQIIDESLDFLSRIFQRISESYFILHACFISSKGIRNFYKNMMTL